MTRSNIAIAGLVAALVGSNAWWAYGALDRGVSFTYLQASYDSNTQLMNQSLAVLRTVLASKIGRNEVVRAAQLGDTGIQPFEKDGYVWVDQLGLKFDKQGNLTHAITGQEEAR